jgi:hypothetical protein
MKTININGKEYTEEEFIKLSNEKDTLSCCVGEDYGLDEFLSTVFGELKSDFPRHEPESPKLRPMSEVRFGCATYLLESKNNIKSWQNGYFNDAMFQEAVILDQGGSFKLSNDYKGTYGQILGWLLPLPNPNDIKL